MIWTKIFALLLQKQSFTSTPMKKIKIEGIFGKYALKKWSVSPKIENALKAFTSSEKESCFTLLHSHFVFNKSLRSYPNTPWYYIKKNSCSKWSIAEKSGSPKFFQRFLQPKEYSHTKEITCSISIVLKLDKKLTPTILFICLVQRAQYHTSRGSFTSLSVTWGLWQSWW